MSDSKQYYYLKLKENFYDSDAMIILESMKDGYLYSNILMKLYLRSLKNEGRLMFNGNIPYNADVLAQVTRHSIGTMKEALRIFEGLGLIEVLDNGAIYMMDIQNYIGKSSTEGDRKRNYRHKIEKEKQEIKQISGQMSGLSSDKHPPEIEKEIELEIKTELEIEKDKKGPKLGRFSPDDGLDEALKEFFKMRKAMKKPMTDRAVTLLINNLNKLTIDPDEQIEILNQSIMNGWLSVYPIKSNQKSSTNNIFLDMLQKGEY